MEKELLKALEEGRLMDFIANEYPAMSNYQLKEIIMALLGVVWDNRKGEDDYIAFEHQVRDELTDRDFFED